MNIHELIENIPVKNRPTPQRGEGVITANRGSPAGVMPSVTKAIAEVPPIGRYARWTGPAGTLKRWRTWAAASLPIS